MNASGWLNALKSAPKKHAIPILSFPSVSLLGINVLELVQSSELQARGILVEEDHRPAIRLLRTLLA